jgi:hypothetical protein
MDPDPSWAALVIRADNMRPRSGRGGRVGTQSVRHAGSGSWSRSDR